MHVYLLIQSLFLFLFIDYFLETAIQHMYFTTLDY